MMMCLPMAALSALEACEPAAAAALRALRSLRAIAHYMPNLTASEALLIRLAAPVTPVTAPMAVTRWLRAIVEVLEQVRKRAELGEMLDALAHAARDCPHCVRVTKGPGLREPGRTAPVSEPLLLLRRRTLAVAALWTESLRPACIHLLATIPTLRPAVSAKRREVVYRSEESYE